MGPLSLKSSADRLCLCKNRASHLASKLSLSAYANYVARLLRPSLTLIPRSYAKLAAPHLYQNATSSCKYSIQLPASCEHGSLEFQSDSLVLLEVKLSAEDCEACFEAFLMVKWISVDRRASHPGSYLGTHLAVLVSHMVETAIVARFDSPFLK